jgi:PAS domain-containing protein
MGFDAAGFCIKLAHEMPDASYADGEGRILFWNRRAERIFGYDESEVLGQSLDIIIPENLRLRHWAGYKGIQCTELSNQQLSFAADRRSRQPKCQGCRLRNGRFSLLIINAVATNVPSNLLSNDIRNGGGTFSPDAQGRQRFSSLGL